MSKLTEEKKESIRKTFRETKSYSITAQIEKVDARTVKKTVEVGPQPATSSSSSADEHGEPSSDVIEPAQLKANELFETGSSTVQVSKTLKLQPSVVIRYRKEYNEMFQADLDDELREKNAQKISLNQTIQHLSKTAQQLKLSIQELADSERACIQRNEIAENRYLENENRQKKMEAEVEVDVPSFIRKLDALQDGLIFEKLIPFYESKLFNRAIVTPVINATLIALMAHPHKRELYATIYRKEGNSVPYDPLRHFSKADFDLLIRDTHKRAVTVIHEYSTQSRHASLEATEKAKKDIPSRKSNNAIDGLAGYPV